jgi:iron complex outermembrane receptor protein
MHPVLTKAPPASRTRSLFAGAALASVLLGTSAAAQTAPAATASTAAPTAAPAASTAPTPTAPAAADAPTAAQNASSGQNTSSGQNAGGSQMSEVVVTATRQSQVLSKVPVSVTAFTQDKMDVLGIKDFGDIARYTPGVVFDPATKDVSIRGVASSAGAATTGIYLDDTPIQVYVIGFNSNNTLPAVFDLDRVEVLRGPQGTLFGAGSEGGTVRYITPQPSLTTYSAYGRTEVSGAQGGDPSGELGLAVGGPIVEDKLGFRISGWYRRDGGYIDRVDQATGEVTNPNANGMDTTVGRVALTWAPIPQLTITPSVYYQSRNQRDTDLYWVGISNPSDGQFRNGDPEARGDKDHYVLPSLKMQYDMDGVSFISNTSYFYRKEITGYEGTLYNLSYFQQLISTPGSCGACNTGNLYPLLTPTGFNLPGFGRYSSPNTVTNKQGDFTQEFRVQSSDPNSRINYVVGVFYQRNRQLSVEEIHDPQLEQITQYLFGESAEDYWGEGLLPQYGDDDYINYNRSHASQIAGFADVTIAVTSQLKVEGGLRYAHTHFDYNWFTDGAQNGGLSNGSGKESEYPLTPKGSIQFQADRNDLFYFTYAKGYRQGGGSPQVSPTFCAADLAALGLTQSPAAYHSDTVDSYEIGSKNKMFDQHLQVEASAYYLRWHNIQQEISLPGCGYQYTGNLGEAESKGFDLQLQYEVIHNLQAEMTFGYTDAKYIKTLYSGSSILANDGDAVGTPFAAPPWTLAFGLQYNFSLLERRAFARVDYEHTAHNSDLTPTLDPLASSYDAALMNPPATDFISLRTGIDIKGVNFSLFVDNLLNSHPGLDLQHQDQYTLLFEQQTFRPRTVGLTGTFRY